MRLSEFWIAMGDEFGEAYGRMLAHDVVLGEIGGLTAEDAIRAGVPVRDIWLAVCKSSDVPPERWYGVGQREPKK
ncbi:MAG: DUF3046 domain-containing protein [Glaciihabitans sp.]